MSAVSRPCGRGSRRAAKQQEKRLALSHPAPPQNPATYWSNFQFGATSSSVPMKIVSKISTTEDLFDAVFSRRELFVLAAALSHVTLRVEESTFHFLFRVSRACAQEMREEILHIMRLIDGGPESGNSPAEGTTAGARSFQIFGTEALVRLARADGKLLVKSLSDLANGTDIYDWEFHMVTQVHRDEARALLEQLHRFIVTAPRDFKPSPWVPGQSV